MPKELRGPEVNGPKSTYMANPEALDARGLLTDDMEILRVSKDGSQRTSVMQSAGLTAFAQKDGNVYATENQKGVIYQVAKNDKWLDEPVVIAKGLNSPGRDLRRQRRQSAGHGEQRKSRCTRRTIGFG